MCSSDLRAATLMAKARSTDRRGYYLSTRGEVKPWDSRGIGWLKMGLDDALKKHNRRTYQDMMHEILGLDASGSRYVLELDASEREFARDYLARAGVPKDGRPLVGLNTGAGGRWQYKRWTVHGFVQLTLELKRRLGAEILLLGGDAERNFNLEIMKLCQTRVYTSGSQSVRRFAAIVDACDIVVTGDTLGMHVAMARKIPTVTLFGPTSLAEIQIYGSGLKIAPEMDCLVCYLERCDKSPACMDLIEPESVFQAIWGLLKDMAPWPGGPEGEPPPPTDLTMGQL